MPREIAIFIFALAAVPLAFFIWEIIWGLLARHWREVMNGIKASGKRATIVFIIAFFALLWLYNDDVNTNNEMEERNLELIKAINQANTELINAINQRDDNLIDAINNQTDALLQAIHQSERVK